MIVEWCTDGSENILRAQELGIKRMELCGALEVGGITPSVGTLKKARSLFSGEIFIMIRPAAGSFTVNDLMLKMMLDEIEWAAAEGVEGVVFGALTEHNEIDQFATDKLLSKAKEYNLQTTFHRAIDLTNNPAESAAYLAQLGFDYILSSGGKPKAEAGIDMLKKMNEAIQGFDTVLLAGSGVSSSNAAKFKASGLSAIHFTARKVTASMPLNMGCSFELDEEKILQIMQQV
ncbi:MAG: copper homeostasis protein CutC [Flavobacteriales bacterium]|nr:copper homeostasis protein CutC [Flavobacteriales bacterium]